MSNIFKINSAKPPVLYSIHISSGYGGITEATMEGVGESEEDKKAIIADLEVIIKSIEKTLTGKGE